MVEGCACMGLLMRRLCSWPKLVSAVVVLLFFGNLILMAGLIDWHLAVQLIANKSGGNKWSDENNDDTNGSSCNLSGEMLASALARMRTAECRSAARRIVCSIDQQTPDSLPNSCPAYDDTQHTEYVGCFRDSPNHRVLSGHYYKFRTYNSPTYCVNMCLRAGYRYAGVEFYDECFCGDVFVSSVISLPESACLQYVCNNRSLFCGGYNAVAVYKTGVTAKPLLIVNYTESDDSLNNVQILFLLQLNGRNTRQGLVAAIRSAGFENVHLMDKRYATIWAGATLLSMVLDVLETTLYSLKWTTWDFVLNLSESDFPLLSMAELETHLARHISALNKGRIFLSSHGYDTARFIQKQGLEYVFLQCEDRMWRIMKRRKFPRSIRLDGGSDWVVLSRDFVLYALSDEELPRSLRQFFSNVLLPVESFFHTLAANSKYCAQTVKGNLHVTNWMRRQGCRCVMLKEIVDWCGCSPLVFRSSDIFKITIEVRASKKMQIFQEFSYRLI
ncbi:unnamed protein product [Gongylonema pulchrum]|uniref:protein xylosyltransferase n=1 Tax=Gongylonema pulchrum TaxID=637853 RepID=A0A3P7MK22_9BILA|nr:unnamed protein product [Gongylonema pulchrum]